MFKLLLIVCVISESKLQCKATKFPDGLPTMGYCQDVGESLKNKYQSSTKRIYYTCKAEA
jgi:hypothetical protein